jgi:hypothetical protein
MDACPDFIGVVKIFACLEREPQLNIKTDLTGQAKLSIFQRSLVKGPLLHAPFFLEVKIAWELKLQTLTKPFLPITY